jgi:mono/diheme cytochrome c family protein
MPAFGSTLTEEQLRAVVLYERVQFGGEDLDVALADCGLAEEAEGEE